MVTPSDEIDRINERLFRESKFQIQDRDSYDLAFEDLIEVDERNLSSRQKTLRNDSFADYKQLHPDVSPERLFRKAKGKDLRRDRLKTAKRVVTTRKKYIKGGASRLDLKGYDTARQGVTKKVIQRRTFTVPALVKGKVTRAVKTSVIVKGKRLVRHRDALGRFASVRLK